MKVFALKPENYYYMPCKQGLLQGFLWFLNKTVVKEYIYIVAFLPATSKKSFTLLIKQMFFTSTAQDCLNQLVLIGVLLCHLIST